jgi:hypothetical protein
MLDANETFEAAVTENLIDAVPYHVTANPTEMEGISDIHIAFDEKRQSLHQAHLI